MSEDPIFSFCDALASFCNHLQSTSDALTKSIERRPIPLDSASSTFVQCLNRRVSSASTDLDLLDSMSFGTVSFEELLGHCNELYKKNQTDLVELEDRLKSYGYVPVPDVEEEDEIQNIQHQISEGKLDSPSFYGSVADSSLKNFEEDDLLDESLSLKKLGLSDACLATLASEGDLSSQEPDKVHEFKRQHQPVPDKMVSSEGRKFLSYEADKENLKSAEAPSSILKILEGEFECLPAYMKGLASWEDLLIAVDKINSTLSKKTNGCNFFRQDEIPSFELGPKAKSYLLLLVRMNRLVVETIDGLLSYRVL
ncbi:uncharacterized protein LOC133314642 [Gastrolobium bilobum]|uniref:uncharacterized protein LOC133314642 n=1 Tax=Gastrolobium bilobum TaxID=150636 RepID=UPI002AB0CF68|nr:uncharacterized protein LOC133314642 [Gastrolobium bilobum]